MSLIRGIRTIALLDDTHALDQALAGDFLFEAVGFIIGDAVHFQGSLKSYQGSLYDRYPVIQGKPRDYCRSYPRSNALTKRKINEIANADAKTNRASLGPKAYPPSVKIIEPTDENMSKPKATPNENNAVRGNCLNATPQRKFRITTYYTHSPRF